jgi:hypothetical protein
LVTIDYLIKNHHHINTLLLLLYITHKEKIKIGTPSPVTAVPENTTTAPETSFVYSAGFVFFFNKE